MKRCHFIGRACVVCYQWPPPVFLSYSYQFWCTSQIPWPTFQGRSDACCDFCPAEGDPIPQSNINPAAIFWGKDEMELRCCLLSSSIDLTSLHTKQGKKVSLVLSSSTIQNLNSILRRLRTSSFFLVLKLGETHWVGEKQIHGRQIYTRASHSEDAGCSRSLCHQKMNQFSSTGLCISYLYIRTRTNLATLIRYLLLLLI